MRESLSVGVNNVCPRAPIGANPSLPYLPIVNHFQHFDPRLRDFPSQAHLPIPTTQAGGQVLWTGMWYEGDFLVIDDGESSPSADPTALVTHQNYSFVRLLAGVAENSYVESSGRFAFGYLNDRVVGVVADITDVSFTWAGRSARIRASDVVGGCASPKGSEADREIRWCRLAKSDGDW